jgi:dihydroflavonol-4-reductase
MHRLAMEVPEAAGNRYICAGEHVWMGEIASVLAQEFDPQGYRIPTRPLPYWLM